MLRLTGEAGKRLVESTYLAPSWAGSEANVAVALSQLGVASRFITRLPDGPLADGCRRALSAHGVELAPPEPSAGRLGVLYAEPGAMLRPPVVTYDRRGSAFAIAEPDSYNWSALLNGVRRLHISGITPALSPAALEASVDAVEAAAGLGIAVSLDLNFRRRLWSSADAARAGMSRLLPYCDIVLGNEEDFAIMVTGEDATIAETVSDQVAHFRGTAERVFAGYPGVRRVYSSIRIAHSVEHNTWSGVSVDRHGKSRTAAIRELRAIVDRIGAGDAFAAGVLLGEETGLDAGATLETAAAAGALAHTLDGDFLTVSRGELEAVVSQGAGGSRIKR